MFVLSLSLSTSLSYFRHFPSLYATHRSLMHGCNTGLTKSPFPINIAFTSSFPVKSGQNKIITPPPHIPDTPHNTHTGPFLRTALCTLRFLGILCSNDRIRIYLLICIFPSWLFLAPSNYLIFLKSLVGAWNNRPSLHLIIVCCAHAVGRYCLTTIPHGLPGYSTHTTMSPTLISSMLLTPIYPLSAIRTLIIFIVIYFIPCSTVRA